MDNSLRPRGHNMRPNIPFPFRVLALMMMIAGAGAFIITLIAFDGRVIYLFMSTLVVFIGLGINIKFRNTDHDVRNSIPSQSPAPISWAKGQRVSGLHSAASAGNQPVMVGPKAIRPGPLCLKVVEYFQNHGAYVRIDSQYDEKCVLNVTSPGGIHILVMVQEYIRPINTSDLRGFYALIKNARTERAILISMVDPDKKAKEWAQQRSILLLSENNIDQISID